MTDLSPTDREALEAALHHIDSSDRGGIPQGYYDRLVALRDACPERPRLEDGIYEALDGDGDYRLCHVRDGSFSVLRRPDGSLYLGAPLPDDVSTWRRIDGPPTVTPEQLDEAARVASNYSEPGWDILNEELRASYRDYARKILAVAGIED